MPLRGWSENRNHPSAMNDLPEIGLQRCQLQLQRVELKSQFMKLKL